MKKKGRCWSACSAQIPSSAQPVLQSTPSFPHPSLERNKQKHCLWTLQSYSHTSPAASSSQIHNPFSLSLSQQCSSSAEPLYKERNTNTQRSSQAVQHHDCAGVFQHPSCPMLGRSRRRTGSTTRSDLDVPQHTQESRWITRPLTRIVSCDKQTL